MKRILRTLAKLILLILAVSPKVSSAQVITNLTLPEYVNQADVICIGTLQGETELSSQPDTDNSFLNTLRGDFHVEHFLKGKTESRDIHIIYNKYRRPSSSSPGGHGFSPYDLLPKLTLNERVLFFLKFKKAKDGYRLVNPIDATGPKIPLGNVDFKLLNDLSPFRATLSVLAQSLQGKNESTQRLALNRLAQINYLLYRPLEFEPTIKWSDNAFKTRTQLKELDRGLEEFVQGSILPNVMKLTSAKNANLRIRALLTAAKLQEVSVIPELHSLSQLPENALLIDAFKCYVVPDAVPLLLPLLEDENPTIRNSAAYSLRWIGDKRALPYLIRLLNTPDKVTYNVLAALQSISGTGPLMSIRNFENEKAKYISYWKEWGETRDSD